MNMRLTVNGTKKVYGDASGLDSFMDAFMSAGNNIETLKLEKGEYVSNFSGINCIHDCCVAIGTGEDMSWK